MREVLEKIRPTKREREIISQVIKECVRNLQDRIKREGIDVEVSLQGSMAKDTWISGDNNIDIFLIFPHSYTRRELKEYGLRIGVLSEHEIAYAEHPYVRNFLKGFEVDVVPAYKFEEGVRSSVDRTPLHTEYVETHLEDKDQVRLLKKFTRSIGVYGSDLKVEGFSGYLCELLVIRYGTFEKVLKAASSWEKGELIILEEEPDKKFDEPLIVVDPVDKNRNVAAVVSLRNFAAFVYHAHKYLKNPCTAYFFRTPETYSRSQGTELHRIDFEVSVIEDILFPQLRKTRDFMVRMLEKYGFRVFNSAVFDSGILVELSVFTLPPYKLHKGPPVYEEEHCDIFTEKYKNVHIRKDRLYTVIERKYTTAEAVLKELLKERKGFGKDLLTAKAQLTLVVGDIDVVVF